MNNETIERLTRQIEQLQIALNQAQTELTNATNLNNQNNQENPNPYRNARELRVGDKVRILNKLKLLGISYPKKSIIGTIIRFTEDYVIISVKVPGNSGAVEQYREVRRASHNLKRVNPSEQ